MKAETWVRVQEIFHAARELPVPQRESYLASTGGDEEVLSEVRRLLETEGGLSPEFLEPLDLAGFAEPAAALEAGARLGDYEVDRVLATGGMGTVYLARQGSPARAVALKTLHSGFRSPSRLERFRQETEVLGRLRHPAIAQIYDAGVGEGAGTPYFAMEYVEDARDIIAYAADEGLSLAERIELFVGVCDAIHHGHQKGVVHRDLKPGNVLVDGAGRAKVIDFGVARVVDGDESGGGRTRDGDLVGTLHYMSPEQVSGTPDAIDTRSDVYALGVLLYELVSGRPPLALEGRSLDAVVKAIQDEDPRPPEGVPQDLSWVIGKALAKEPRERYASASELAADLQRFLRGQPVLAGAPGVAYRARKFAWRHRLLLGAALAVFGALALGLVKAEGEAARARREERKAVQVASFLRTALTSVDPNRTGEDARLVDALAEAQRRLGSGGASPEATAVIDQVMAESYLALRLFDEAERHLDRAEAFVDAQLSADHPVAIDVGSTRMWFLYLTGDFEGAAGLGRDVEARAVRVLGALDERTVDVQFRLAEIVKDCGFDDEAADRYDAVIDDLTALYGPRHTHVLAALGGRALTWVQQGRLEEARDELVRVLALCRESFPEDHFRVVNAIQNVGIAHFYLGEFEEAAEAFRAYETYARTNLGDDHPFAAYGSMNVGSSLFQLKRFDEAARALEAGLSSARAVWGDENDTTLTTAEMLARSYLELGRYEDAERVLAPFLEYVRANADPEWPTYVDITVTDAWVEVLTGGDEDAARRRVEELRARLAPGDGLDRCEALLRALSDQ